MLVFLLTSRKIVWAIILKIVTDSVYYFFWFLIFVFSVLANRLAGKSSVEWDVKLADATVNCFETLLVFTTSTFLLISSHYTHDIFVM